MHPFRSQSRRSGPGARLLGLCSLLVAAYSWGTDARTWVPLVARRASEWGRAATEEELKKTVPTLYVYDHCPFCVRARMIFGLKRMPFKLDFLMNDDVVTPTKMTGKKVLPILEMEGEAMGESLDIVAKIDAIGKPILAKAADRTDIDQWLKDNKDLMRKLTRPRDAYALYPEFATRAARATWVKNHQLSGSSFEEALDSSEEYLKQINDELPKLAEMIHGDTVNVGGVSYDDITLWPTLRRLTIVKGIKWPEKLRNYLLYMEDVCDVPILEGMAI